MKLNTIFAALTVWYSHRDGRPTKEAFLSGFSGYLPMFMPRGQRVEYIFTEKLERKFLDFIIGSRISFYNLFYDLCAEAISWRSLQVSSTIKGIHDTMIRQCQCDLSKIGPKLYFSFFVSFKGSKLFSWKQFYLLLARSNMHKIYAQPVKTRLLRQLGCVGGWAESHHSEAYSLQTSLLLTVESLKLHACFCLSFQN